MTGVLMIYDRGQTGTFQGELEHRLSGLVICTSTKGYGCTTNIQLSYSVVATQQHHVQVN